MFGQQGKCLATECKVQSKNHFSDYPQKDKLDISTQHLLEKLDPCSGASTLGQTQREDCYPVLPLGAGEDAEEEKSSTIFIH